ncbi:MAG: glyoxalase superfamily protein, partial [Pseudomonadota bacterium]
MTQDLPLLAEAKLSAKHLRADLAAEGVTISHSQALEKIAHGFGFRDWNGLHAAIRDLPERGWRAGQRVTGLYLSQRFRATVMSAEEGASGWFEITLDLDEAVDVVRFEGMSNMRKRIRAQIGP